MTAAMRSARAGRYAFTTVWAAGVIVRVVVSEELAEARAAAEAVAEARR